MNESRKRLVRITVLSTAVLLGVTSCSSSSDTIPAPRPIPSTLPDKNVRCEPSDSRMWFPIGSTFDPKALSIALKVDTDTTGRAVYGVVVCNITASVSDMSSPEEAIMAEIPRIGSPCALLGVDNGPKPPEESRKYNTFGAVCIPNAGASEEEVS